MSASLLLLSAQAWAPISPTSTEVGSAWRWTSPVDYSQTTEGLASGISYRISDSFCDTLLPTFHDDLFENRRIFVTCNALRDAVAGAFEAWSTNHRSIKFINAGSNGCVPNAELPGCMPVEVLISAEANFSNPHLGAFVLHRIQQTATRKTNGNVTTSGGSIQSAELHVNAGVCWYLDNTFCFRFDHLKKSLGARQALIAGQAILVAVWTLCLLFFLYEILMVGWALAHILHDDPSTAETPELARRVTVGRNPTRATLKRLGTTMSMNAVLERRKTTHAAYFASSLPVDSSRSERLSELAFNVATRHNGCLQSAVWLLLLFPPIFFWKIFQPCWSCYDFSSAITHEVGHVLGLDHPDQHALNGTNLFALRPMGPDTCMDEMTHVRQTSTPPNASVMFQFTQNSPHGCLAPDDLEGLNFLYPSCVGALDRVRCRQQTSNVGWLRLAFSVAMPLAATLSATLLVTFYAKRRHARRLRETKAQLRAVISELERTHEAEQLRDLEARAAPRPSLLRRLTSAATLSSTRDGPIATGGGSLGGSGAAGGGAARVLRTLVARALDASRRELAGAREGRARHVRRSFGRSSREADDDGTLHMLSTARSELELVENAEAEAESSLTPRPRGTPPSDEGSSPLSQPARLPPSAPHPAALPTRPLSLSQIHLAGSIGPEPSRVYFREGENSEGEHECSAGLARSSSSTPPKSILRERTQSGGGQSVAFGHSKESLVVVQPHPPDQRPRPKSEDEDEDDDDLRG